MSRTYTRIISNHRITGVTDKETTFSYKDYRNDSKSKTMTLSNEEFVRRFSMHILPSRFVRIRHYGILSSNWKRGKLRTLQMQLNIKRPELKAKTLLRKCPCCKTGTLISIDVFGKR
ncbi:MAG: transposase [Sphingobacteriales bacterium]|nr:transposase [Sphingobacteriales bacterium]